MARKKGTGRRARVKGIDLDSISAQLVEKLNQKTALEQESEALTAKMAESKQRLKEIRISLKKLERNISALESMREELGTAKMTEKAMSELQPKVAALLNSGKTIEEIVGMLGE